MIAILRLEMRKCRSDLDIAFRNAAYRSGGHPGPAGALMVLKPWVAQITGADARYGLAREFLGYSKDYSEAASSERRGVLLVFVLHSGRVYEVSEIASKKKTRRYFVQVTSDGGDIVEIEREEVDQWLSSSSILETKEG